jgi:hypothetical protein
LRHCDDDPPENLPRMADAAIWVSAGEESFGWVPGTFLAAYRRNILIGARTAVESDPLGAAVVAFMSMPEPMPDSKPGSPSGRRECWSGTATELLQHLRIVAGEGAARSRNWPRTPSWLGRSLRPLAPALSKLEIELSISPTHHSQRLLTLCWRDSKSTAASDDRADSAASPDGPQPPSPSSDGRISSSTHSCMRVKL